MRSIMTYVNCTYTLDRRANNELTFSGSNDYVDECRDTALLDSTNVNRPRSIENSVDDRRILPDRRLSGRLVSSSRRQTDFGRSHSGLQRFVRSYHAAGPTDRLKMLAYFWMLAGLRVALLALR